VKLKLTKKQKLNLLRLSQGKHISVCTQVGRKCGQVLFETGENATSYLAAINTFYSWGLFDEEEHWVYGIRYSLLTVNEKGKLALLNAEVVSE
jgi:hypothetical protein